MFLTKPLVKQILLKASSYEWTLQGLGMLRMYLSDTLRLHVWDGRYTVKDVSQMHTHPWDFTSRVVAGVVHNQRFAVYAGDHAYQEGIVEEYYQQSIFCGMGGGLEGLARKVLLEKLEPEVYREGAEYNELAHEIHLSAPENGTVTIIERKVIDDPDHALVFWKDGDWVSAEPRAATWDEILEITGYSLRTWF